MSQKVEVAGGPVRVRYQVAVSLDGYIADPQGGYDWIPQAPDIDFAGLFAEFDTLLMGRVTYQIINPADAMYAGMKIVVVSRTLAPDAVPANVRVVSGDLARLVAELRAQARKDIWLFGGGQLFRSLLEIGCVDTVEPAITPVLLGAGIPMYPGPHHTRTLKLIGQRVYEQSGIVLMQYAVVRPRDGA